VNSVWNAYTYSGGRLEGRPLPHLPSAITLRDLGVESEQVRLYVFVRDVLLEGGPPLWAARMPDPTIPRTEVHAEWVFAAAARGR
jgi:hypothetical protein